jgi:DNA polymerase
MADAVRQVKRHLDALKAAGVEFIPDRRNEITFVPATPDAAPSAPVVGDPLEDRRHALAVLAEQVSKCDRCKELFSTRTQTVFGVGPVSPELCFVGEAPGGDEDRLGEPFVGAAGQLLNKIIAAMGLSRGEVYICNTLKCRPPQNRTPSPQECANCRDYFEQQIELVNPRLICCLGAVASKNVLGSSLGIGRLRGRFHDYKGIPVMCTYHPSYLLRLTGADEKRAKNECWDDMKQILRRMGRSVSSR